MDSDRELSIVNALRHCGEGSVQVLLLRKLQAGLDHGTEHLTCDGPHGRLRRRELWDDVLKDELFHIALDVRVTHDEWTQSCGLIESTVALGRGRLTV